MEKFSESSTQSNYLSEIKEQQSLVIIYLMNGFQMKGKIIDFDEETILFENCDGRKQLVYKHALSTVSPPYQDRDIQKRHGWI